MTPEQQEFHEKLGDALNLCDAEKDVPSLEWLKALNVINEAAQKLHDLWPTLCEAEWQSIETAPKDEVDCGYDGVMTVRILTYDEGWCPLKTPVVAYWDVTHWQVEGRDDDTTHYTPTHWKPLPEPPTISKAVSGG